MLFLHTQIGKPWYSSYLPLFIIIWKAVLCWIILSSKTALPKPHKTLVVCRTLAVQRRLLGAPKMTVSVVWGCSNKIPETGWLIKKQIFTFHSSACWEFQDHSTSQPMQCLVRAPCITDDSSSLCSPMVEGAREPSGIFFMGSLVPLMRASPHDLITATGPSY